MVVMLVSGGIVYSLLNEKPASRPDAASEAAAREWVDDQLDPNHVILKAEVQDCMATPGCDVAVPSSPSSTTAKPALPVPVKGPDGMFVLSYTNPADTDFCNQSQVLGNLYWAAARITQRSDIQIQSVIAGENDCESNDPDACKIEVHSKDHVCHGILALAGAGNFYVNEDDPLKTTFRSDAQARAAVKDSGQGETPAEYCADLTSDACDRIKAVIRTGINPPYCRPGWGVVGSPENQGLTFEQVRTCSMMEGDFSHLSTR